MNSVLQITLFGFLSGIVGTAIGGCAAFFMKDIRSRTMSGLLELSAGIMMSVLCFDLLPHAFSLAGFYIVLAGLCAGVLFAMLLQDFIKYGKNGGQQEQTKKKRMFKTGVLMFISIAVHNFPEGLAVGSGFVASTALGLSLALVILIHDIPEGMAMAVPLRSGGAPAYKAALTAAVSGLPMGLGALAGALIGGISKEVISMCLALSAGAMLYISMGDLVPESKRIYTGRFPSVLFVVGVILGIILCFGLG